MVQSISTNNINPIQMMNALGAFRATEQIKEANSVPETSDGIDINDKSILKNQDTAEIKQFAQIAGEDNLTNEDIQYGLTYGRSVIADYSI